MRWLSAVMLIALEIAAAQELLFVHLTWRHGDRTPAESFLNKTEAAKVWPEGGGELTRRGMLQQFHLGELLKQKYVDNQRLLSRNYKADEIYIRSSDYNRTLMSAYATLAGLYYPVDKSQLPSTWPSDLAWRPIPVHTYLRTNDPLMWMNYKCPRVKQVTDQIIATPPFSVYNEENQKLFAYLTEKGQMGKMTMQSLWKLHDPLTVQKLNNISWPSWMNAIEEFNLTNTSMYEKIDSLNEVAMLYLLNDEKIVPFRGGYLLRDIVDRMKAKITQKLSPSLKLYAYSGHDLTLVSLLEALRAYPKKIPHYSACISMELWRRDNEHFVKVLYRSGYETPEFKDITSTVIGCADASTDLGCKFSVFTKNVEPLLYPGGDFDTNCRINATEAEERGKSEQFYRSTTIVVRVLLGFFVLLSAALLWLYLRAQRASVLFRLHDSEETYRNSVI